MHHAADEVVPRAGSTRDDEQASAPDPESLDEPDAAAYSDFPDWEPACAENLLDGPVVESLSESEAPFDFLFDWRRIAPVACGDATLPAANSPAWDQRPFSLFLMRIDCTWDTAARKDERVSSSEALRACRQRLICHRAPATCTFLHKMRRGVRQSGPVVLRCYL